MPSIRELWDLQWEILNVRCHLLVMALAAGAGAVGVAAGVLAAGALQLLCEVAGRAGAVSVAVGGGGATAAE